MSRFKMSRDIYRRATAICHEAQRGGRGSPQWVLRLGRHGSIGLWGKEELLGRTILSIGVLFSVFIELPREVHPMMI